jgi:flagellar motility protein MotE (MotC chaperone)
MLRLLQSNWMVALLGAFVYLGSTVLFWKVPPRQRPTEHAAPTLLLGGNGPSWNFLNPEIDQLLAELRTEREALAKREEELNALAERLKSERLEINQVTQAVYLLQRELDQSVVRVAAEETANCKRLAKVYAAMDPAAAANILKELDDPTLAKILVFLKDAEVAPILEALSKQSDAAAQRAAAISELLRLTLAREPANKPQS